MLEKELHHDKRRRGRGVCERVRRVYAPENAYASSPHEGGEKKVVVDIAAIALERQAERVAERYNSDIDDALCRLTTSKREEIPMRKIKFECLNKRDRVNEIVSNPTFDLVSRILIVLKYVRCARIKAINPTRRNVF